MSPQVTKEVFVYLLGLVTPLSSCLRQSTVNFAAGKFAAACRLSHSKGKAFCKTYFQLQRGHHANSFRTIGERKAKKIPLRCKHLALLSPLPRCQKFDFARVVACGFLSITISAGYAQDDT